MPRSESFKAHCYQNKIIAHIITHPRSAIWAGMGMGKTVATLTAYDILREQFGYKRLLVLAPLRVAKHTWAAEVAKWKHLCHLSVAVACGEKREARVKALSSDADIVCMNYEALPWLAEGLKSGAIPPRCGQFDMIVCDESTRIKGFRRHSGSLRAKALDALAWDGVSSFVELTGTPASNGYLDLWGQLWFIDKGARLCSTFKAYQMRYFSPTRVGASPYALRWDIVPGAEEEIVSRLRDVTLKLNSEDWFDIEKPIVTKVPVTLPPKAMKAYRELERELYAQIDSEEIVAANAAVRTGKCLQLASGAIYKTEGSTEWTEVHDAKLEALGSIVEEAAGMPILVAYQFKHEAERILKAFPGARKLDKNPKTIDAWNAGKLPMLLAHPASCGHGLSLQDGGNILVFFSSGWNMEEHEQIIERIGPMRQKQSGHNRNVFIYNIVAEHTVDEDVLKRLETKRSVLDILLERKNGL